MSQPYHVPSLDPIPFAQKAVSLAQEAHDANTFAVGGVLLDKTGKIWKSMHNNALVEKVTQDPTAHAELQLTSWYYERKKADDPIPPPDEMTIVTSLDPCMMCTGALLASGINVAVISLDQEAGIDLTFDKKFSAVPEPIRFQAMRQFAYLGLDNKGRDYVGSTSSVFNGGVIPSALEAMSSSLCAKSVSEVRHAILPEDPKPYNIKSLGDDSSQLKLLKNYYPDTALLTADISQPSGRVALYAAMEEIAKKSHQGGGTRNSAALIDPFNNVLLIMGSSESVYKIDTPLMRLTRVYAACRRLARMAQDGALPHPKRCKIVLFNGPGQSATDLLDLGGYSASMKGPAPSDNPYSLCYFHAVQPPDELDAMIRALPPFYSQFVTIRPVQLQV